MILYLETSSLLKLYIQEPGSESVDSLRKNADEIASSAITYVEARSGLARAVSIGRLNEADYPVIRVQFDVDWRVTAVVEPVGTVIRRAANLAEKHLLRGYDAVHLASVLALADRAGQLVALSTFDDQLRDAAAAEGVRIA